MAAILVVEDEAQVRVLAESYLREQGHQTFTAATIDEAVAVLDQSADINLLLVDIELFGDVHAGLNLARRAVDRRPDLDVLYVSGHSVTDGMKALFVENSAFLAKPYTVDQLQTSLLVHFGVRPNSPP
jgi:two-component system cell cycle sensor histidine kinase/response regulator CckA